MGLLTDLVAYYKLDEASGNASDSIGSNTLTNTNSVTYTVGILNNCAVFSHSSAQYLKIEANLGFTSTSQNSWSFWVKPVTVANGGYYMDIMTTSGARRGLSIYNRNPNLCIYTWSNDFDSAVAFSNGTWYHVVVTNNGSGTLECFVNAVSKGTVSLSTSSSDNVNAVTVGGQNGTATSTSSNIDEVGIWTRVLSGAEITQLYNGGSPLPLASFSATPTVTTQAVSDITNITATGNGNVTSDGGSAITERGVCIGYSANPTTAGTKFSTTGTTGAFTVSMTSLTKNTHYHARAYAINVNGTSYGADVEFDTTNLPADLRDFTNKPGAVYDVNKTTVIFAEDMALIKEWIEYLKDNL